MIYLFIIIIALIISFVVTYIIDSHLKKRNSYDFLYKKNKNDKDKYYFMYDLISSFGKGQRADIQNKLEMAGIYESAITKYYISTKYLSFLTSVVVVFFLFDSLKDIVTYTMLLLVVIIVVPDMYLFKRKNSMLQMYSSQLPYLLDMMSVCLQTGMTIEATLRYLSEELGEFNSHLCRQITLTSETVDMKGLDIALKELLVRVPIPEMRSFILTLIQNIQYGTPIASVLSDLAEDSRREEILLMEEKVGKLSAKMSIPLILLIMSFHIHHLHVLNKLII